MIACDRNEIEREVFLTIRALDDLAWITCRPDFFARLQARLAGIDPEPHPSDNPFTTESTES
ncbi:MAG: hypothetical protein KA419_02700 [Acidobacteria bacterium]|nr:hypothetical protein [Acidobacteriota bacterium]